MYQCKRCGWKGEVKGRQRCLACARRRTKEWRRHNPEKARAQKRRYEKRFRIERREEYNAKRRRKRSVLRTHEAYMRRKRWLMTGTVTRSELVNIWEKAKGLCHYCDGPVGRPRFSPWDMRGFDHVISRQNGGKNDSTNIVVCCRQCNERKG